MEDLSILLRAETRVTCRNEQSLRDQDLRRQSLRRTDGSSASNPIRPSLERK
jgi:hypothetical protein